MRVDNIKKIILFNNEKKLLIQHCLRKLNEFYEPSETREKKAYGLLGGKVENNFLYINYIKPLRVNFRSQYGYKQYMDDILNKYAEASETPLSKRGWVASPDELESTFTECDKKNIELVGNYHMHRVAWKHDLTRELPTKLDYVLAKDSGFITFIISAVDLKNLIIRAFFEGDSDKEIDIQIEE